jgi:transcriptional regulator with XRE-family HTH domain
MGLTKEQIGKQLRGLRLAKGLTQRELAEGCAGLDYAAISMFERGETLKRFHRHAPALAAKLGPRVYLLAHQVIAVAVIGDLEDGSFDQQLLDVLGEYLEERVAAAEQGRPARGARWDQQRWGPLPSAQELAERLGLTEKGKPLDLVEATRLGNAMQRLGFVRGWSVSPAGTRASDV